MRCVIQRVSYAQVFVSGDRVARIEKGLCVLVGVGNGDSSADVEYMAQKLAGLRVFEDTSGKMNLDVSAVAGAILLVSQFTLFGDMRRGNRPSFSEAAPPELAKEIYEQLADRLRSKYGLPVQLGQFRAHMNVDLINDGPVTILLDSKKLF